MAYLTLDADVKEELCKDTSALTSLFDLAKVGLRLLYVCRLSLVCATAQSANALFAIICAPYIGMLSR